ncbi:hypothetical protein QYF36_011150 [Acer negundo]|nr:hypothetical protein QYF36_011150 [Acer negundo]
MVAQLVVSSASVRLDRAFPIESYATQTGECLSIDDDASLPTSLKQAKLLKVKKERSALDKGKCLPIMEKTSPAFPKKKKDPTPGSDEVFNAFREACSDASLLKLMVLPP